MQNFFPAKISPAKPFSHLRNTKAAIFPPKSRPWIFSRHFRIYKSKQCPGQVTAIEGSALDVRCIGWIKSLSGGFSGSEDVTQGEII